MLTCQCFHEGLSASAPIKLEETSSDLILLLGSHGPLPCMSLRRRPSWPVCAPCAWSVVGTQVRVL